MQIFRARRVRSAGAQPSPAGGLKAAAPRPPAAEQLSGAPPAQRPGAQQPLVQHPFPRVVAQQSPSRQAQARRPPSTLRELLEDQGAHLRQGLSAWRSQQLARRALRRRIERYLKDSGLPADVLLGAPPWAPASSPVAQSSPMSSVGPAVASIAAPAAGPIARSSHAAPAVAPAPAPIAQPPAASARRPAVAVDAEILARWLPRRPADDVAAGLKPTAERAPPGSGWLPTA